MRIKKEYIGLAVAIVVLALYLALRDTDRTHYELPVLEPLEDSKIDRLLISRPDGELRLARRGDGWVIEPEGYPVSGASIDEMLKSVGALAATSLVSESESYAQYDLGEDSRIVVEAFGGSELLRRFDVGKAASTYRHTYVLFEGDPRVYQARGNIKRIFEKKVDQLRDRAVHAVDRAGVTSIMVRDDSGSLTLEKVTRSIEPSGDGESAPTPVIAWLTADSLQADGEVVDNILGSTVNLQADGFPDGITNGDLGEPEFTLVTSGVSSDTLFIYGERGDEKKFLTASSKYPFPFLISEWKVKQIRKSPAEIMGDKKGE